MLEGGGEGTAQEMSGPMRWHVTAWMALLREKWLPRPGISE